MRSGAMVSVSTAGHPKPYRMPCVGRSDVAACAGLGGAPMDLGTCRVEPNIGSTNACWLYVQQPDCRSKAGKKRVSSRRGASGKCDSRLEAVAHTRFGQQMFGMRRITFEFAPQLCQIHTQIMGFGRIRRSPHLFEEFFAADQLAAVAHQHLEHAPFGRGE